MTRSDNEDNLAHQAEGAVRCDGSHRVHTDAPVVDGLALDTEGRRDRIVVLAIGGLLALTLLLKAWLHTPNTGGDHYVYLASHLVAGDLSVDTLPGGYQDYVSWQGHKYLPLGPLPGVTLIPALPFLDTGRTRIIIWVEYLLTLFNVWLLYRVLGRAGVLGDSRLWALLLFFGGTIYLSAAAAGNSWYYAHVLTTTFLLWAVYETLGRGRAWLVGLALGLAGTTRVTALFALPFVLWMFWTKTKNNEGSDGASPATRDRALALRPFALALGLLLVGLAGPLALLLAYNYARFGNVLESGYGHAVLTYPPLAEALERGLFSLQHVPKNLFMLFLQGPIPYPSDEAPVLQFPFMQPSKWGMGIFFTSPALLYAFRANFRSQLSWACLLGVISIMIPLITYYGVGWIQFGYRYGLDFIPLLLLLAALGLPRPMTLASRVLVLVSVAINIWGTIFLISWV
jgi:hypothetical protein